MLVLTDPKRDPVPATVIKVGRVWITVAPKERSVRVWRFRLDTQSDGSDCGYPVFFRTAEQQRYHEIATDATAYLHRLGVRIEHYSPLRRADATISLARMIYRSGMVPDIKKA